mmetsp:Transcript_9548/g.27165  ORF Transcript_9548/g.27165 Transcript_9548/m.27165 type:complete len:370 (-) Transcript_9548:1208-2317(-)
MLKLKQVRRRVESRIKGSDREKDPELEDFLKKFEKYSDCLSSIKKDGDQVYMLLNKLSGKADDFSCSMMSVEQLVYVPSDPEELERKRKTEGFPLGCRAYANAFVSSFMTVLDKAVEDQKKAAKIVNALRKAQVETDHYLRKCKVLKEKNEKPDKIASNETKLQQAIKEEEQLQGECVTFLSAFLTNAPVQIFTANLELLFAQDEFSKTLNECAKFTLENPPEWIEDVCRQDASMTMKAQRASRRSSLPIASNLPKPPQNQQEGQADTWASNDEMAAELEKLRLQNKKGASAYENLRAKAMEYKAEVEALRKQLASLEQGKNGAAPTSAGGPALGLADFGFAPPAPTQPNERPNTPSFSFDPSAGQSLI